MDRNIIQRYTPNSKNNFIIRKNIISMIDNLIGDDNLYILLWGSSESGKTTICNSIINDNYKNNEKNVLINELCDTTTFYKTELKHFCQTISNKKKLLIIDDIDNCKDSIQHQIRTYIETYKKNIFVVITCFNYTKVIPQIKSHLLTIKLESINNSDLLFIYNYIDQREHLNLEKRCIDFLINNSNKSIRLMLNNIQKIILHENVDYSNITELCYTVSYSMLEKLNILILTERKLIESSKFIMNINNSGISVIDILENYYQFIKVSSLCDSVKCKIIKIISKYINKFHSLHETHLELYNFVYELYYI